MVDPRLGDVKIFCIGLPKTGTTSLRALMKSNGVEEGSYYRQERDVFAHNYKKVLDNYDKGQYFSNDGNYLMYKLAFEKYGFASRYILTLRKDSRLWFESLKRHTLYANPLRHKHYRMFGRFYANGFDQEHMEYYERHNAEVVRFFAERKASHILLTLRVDEPDAIEKLSQFLGIAFNSNKFPKENVSSRNRQGFGNHFKKTYNMIVQTAYAHIAPLISTRSPRQALPAEPPTRSS